MCLEYSLRGSRQSQTTPMKMHRAERYGGSFRRRGSRRKAKMVGASMAVGTYSIHGSHINLSCTYISMPCRSIAVEGQEPSVESQMPQLFTLLRTTTHTDFQHRAHSALREKLRLSRVPFGLRTSKRPTNKVMSCSLVLGEGSMSPRQTLTSHNCRSRSSAAC